MTQKQVTKSFGVIEENKSELKSTKTASQPNFESAVDDVPPGRQVSLPNGRDVAIRLKSFPEANKTVAAEVELANDRHQIESLLKHKQNDAKVAKLRGIGPPLLDKGSSTNIFNFRNAKAYELIP